MSEYDLYNSKEVYSIFLDIYFSKSIRITDLVKKRKQDKGNTSHKIKCLKEMGIINKQQKGKNTYYSINKKKLKEKFPNFKPNKKILLIPKRFSEWVIDLEGLKFNQKESELMSEKVLGFKEKDGCKVGEDIEHIDHINIKLNKLVPVVSVEKIKRICKQLILEEEHWAKGKSYIGGVEDVLEVVRLQTKPKEATK